LTPSCGRFGFNLIVTAYADLGIVVQGPAVSTGLQGRSRSIDYGTNTYGDGYSCEGDIRENLITASRLFDQAVVSTWVGSGLRDSLSDTSAAVIESQDPIQDFDNRRRQFISTFRGIEHLRSLGVTHAVKIRTDQILAPRTFTWIKDRFINQEGETGPLIMSDFLAHVPFYVGDFVIAGPLHTVSTFCSSQLGYGSSNIQQEIGKDYVLKYLMRVDPEFYEKINVRIPISPQLSDPRNIELRKYWLRAREHYFDFLPKEELATIIWRGKPMDKILKLNAFGDQKENTSSKLEAATSVGVLKAWRQIMQSGHYEFMRYYRREGRDNLGRLAKGLWTGSYEWPRE